MTSQIENFDKIDLNKHALIEASAGTGKTYTLENLVIRLLNENYVDSIQSILIVTFTEKAASELKERIRGKLIEIVYSNQKEIHPKLKESLDNFDKASIYTIHGFCNHVLNQYTFENGLEFERSLVSDFTVYSKLLTGQILNQWENDFKEDLEYLLEFCIHSLKNWEKEIVNLALKFNPNNHKIIPDFNLDDFSPFIQQIKNLKKSFEEELLNRKVTLEKFKDKFFEREDVSELITKLKVYSILTLKLEAAKYKLENGLFSYDDMLLVLEKALDPTYNPNSEMLLGKLRKEYKYALIDEFQDTDIVQWNIFSKIFFRETLDNKIFLIGDPKQAIYNFRGADIYVYLSVKKTILDSPKIANTYSLVTNFRSHKSLIQIYNELFKEKFWFESKGIDYYNIEAAPKELLKYNYSDIDEKRRFLNIIDLQDGEEELKTELAKERYADFIANEIKYLLENKSIQKIKKGSTTKESISADDICILIRKQNESALIEKKLEELNIPFTFYKKSGLYETVEAFNLIYLFQAILNPGNKSSIKKALLTEFFGYKLENLLNFEDVELIKFGKSYELILEWNELSKQKKYSHLFYFIMLKSNLLKNIHNENGEIIERKITNYKQILENLEQVASRNKNTFDEIVTILNRYIHDKYEVEDNSDLQREESEKLKVKIMTMHICKGLEFPIVFVYGGISAGKPNSYYKFHDKNGNIVYDLMKQEENQSTAQTEEKEEEKRLFYVAFTRAMFRLYIPKLPKTGSKIKSPICDFVYDSIGRIESNTNLEIKNIDYNNYPTFDKSKIETIIESEKTNMKKSISQNLEYKFDLNTRKIYSYTKIKKHFLNKDWTDEKSIQFTSKEIVDYEENYLENKSKTFTSILPGGKKIGILIHEILEKINFEHFDFSNFEDCENSLNSEVKTIIDEKLRKYHFDFEESVKKELIAILYRTLSTPLKSSYSSNEFQLNKINREERNHEVSFLYNIHALLSSNNLSNTFQNIELMNGSIDLAFRSKEGAYYIADWKTDSLSPELDLFNYNSQSIENYMKRSGYNLQYKIYSIAFYHWLKLQKRDFNFEKDFGGIYYFFLRGMNGIDSKEGIYFYRPKDEEEIIYYENLIKEKKFDELVN